MNDVYAVVLAAGRGTRMRSELPKVLHQVAGQPMLHWVLSAARQAGCQRLLVVVGHESERVRRSFPAEDIEWIVQEEQRGTGHALAQVQSAVRGDASLLVLSGDVPLVTAATLESLVREAAAGWGAMAIARLESPGSLGRVVATQTGGLERIVEAVDASDEELENRWVNAGLYALPAPEVFDYLERLQPDNAKGELYLTDALTAAVEDGRVLRLVELLDATESLGVNDREDLSRAHRVLVDRKLKALQSMGVTILDPRRVVIEPGVEMANDCVVHAGVSILGATAVGRDCVVHQGSWIRDSHLGEGVVVEPYSVIDGAQVHRDAIIGPFARLRPGTIVRESAKVGNFVETKNADLGRGVKANHLAYLGDVAVGDRSNIGAGVVTCNYDGIGKHSTSIGERAFVGSDTMLIAPVEIGDGAMTAAGSVVTKDVPAGSLAVARPPQRNLLGWVERFRRRRRR